MYPSIEVRQQCTLFQNGVSVRRITFAENALGARSWGMEVIQPSLLGRRGCWIIWGKLLRNSGVFPITVSGKYGLNTRQRIKGAAQGFGVSGSHEEILPPLALQPAKTSPL